MSPDAMEFYTKDPKLPLELRALPYDVNSVMHFGERDFSKNGHRTIIFKDHKVVQNRIGLSDIDLRKIEIVYGPECQKRDRQEKKDLCQLYPGVVRKKRDVNIEETANLRVNRDIKPPSGNISEEVSNMIEELEIGNEIGEVIHEVYKVAGIAIEKARARYCNGSKAESRRYDPGLILQAKPTVVGIIESVAKFTKLFVDQTVANLTVFCGTMDALEAYQRTVCQWGKDPRCPTHYRSTKSGPVKHSTQHRPVHLQSTKHHGKGVKYQYDKVMRSSNVTVDANSTAARRKREAHKEGVEAAGEGKRESLRTGSLGARKSDKSEHVLRSVTSVVSPKKEDFAPLRRIRNKRFRYD